MPSSLFGKWRKPGRCPLGQTRGGKRLAGQPGAGQGGSLGDGPVGAARTLSIFQRPWFKLGPGLSKGEGRPRAAGPGQLRAVTRQWMVLGAWRTT